VSDRISTIRAHVEALETALALWATRDDSRAQPAVRSAANTAVDSIDSILTGLYRLREELIGQIRQADDANAARVNAYLAAVRERREQESGGER
jgi:hypothetical protein